MALAELARPPAPAAFGRRPAMVVARRTAQSAGRAGLLWGYVFGVFVASAAWSYTSIYKTQAQRDQLQAAFGANKATIALFGPAPALNTVQGFTVFKVSMTLMIIGAVWGLLTSSRLLRGEEDAGRWDLLLAGQTTRRAATAQALAGLGVGVVVLWAVTAVIAALAGLSARVDIAAGPALFLALALVSPALMFLAVGAVTSQLAPTRRVAAGYGAVVLGVSYGLRMVGDAGIGLNCADVALTARMGGAPGAADVERPLAARADCRLHRHARRAQRRAGRSARRRAPAWYPTVPTAHPGCGCSAGRSA